ncbi:hypothetical protein NQ314_019909 [Rhamnusium bicolor]|uniref:THAP9-like helix-turn-helix domain-containing protein n=1 Tax=Rhamnusium bicolor TaxID=1586634 RepID=A0AAV8WM93_9CUCU|nr:hypothetical protein NQ314_019909 [Rhamnusium bicolor]
MKRQESPPSSSSTSLSRSSSVANDSPSKLLLLESEPFHSNSSTRSVESPSKSSTLTADSPRVEYEEWEKQQSSSSTITLTEPEKDTYLIRPANRKRFHRPRYIGDCDDADMAASKKNNTELENCKKRLLISKEKKFNSFNASLMGPAAEVMKRVLKGPSTQKYSPALRTFALTLNFYSSKAYNYVREKFNKSLPSTRTLSEWYRSVDGTPGFTNEAAEALKCRRLLRCISKRREEQKNNSDKQNTIDVSEYQTTLKVMEYHIDSELLLKFKSSTIGSEITESPLFNMWKTIQEGSNKEIATETVHDYNQIVSNNNIQDNTFINIEMIDLSNEIFLSEELMRLPVEIDGVVYENADFNNDPTFSNVNRSSDVDQSDGKGQKMEPVRIKVLHQGESQNLQKGNLKVVKKIVVHSNITVQDAWSDHLHWPKIEEKGVKRKSATPMPFAITSKKWKEYAEDIEARKREKEDLKMQKKHVRDQKLQEQNKNKGKRKNVQKDKPKAADIETATVHSKTPEAPKPKITTQSTKKGKIPPIRARTSVQKSGVQEEFELSISVGSYVILKYEQQYFPGIVESIEGEEYEIRAMSPSGSNYFKWPNPPDQIWYKKTAIKEVIEAPKLIKRGCYECPEISKYI